MDTNQSSPASAGLSIFTVPLLIAVMVFAPLIKGGNRPIPLLVLQIAALALVLLVFLDWRRLRMSVSPLIAALLSALLVWPLLQLAPLGQWAWATLPGRDLYLPALSAVGLAPAHAAISVVPRATEAAWLTLLPPVAVFLAMLTVPREKLKVVAYVLVGVAAAQAIIGLAQYGTRSYSVIFSDNDVARNAYGTYANYDHLAGLLEMALPVALGLLAASIQGRPRAPQSASRMSSRVSRKPFEGLRSNYVAIFSAATVAILLGLIFSRSRTGIALTMLVILVCALLFARRMGTKKSASILTVVAVVGVAGAVEIGLAPVLARFTQESTAGDLRWPIFAATFTGVKEFLPFGSGVGTFPLVFRSFQPAEVPLFVNHAHNDYLEWAMDAGVIAAILVVLALVLIARSGIRLLRMKVWTATVFCQVGALIGLSAMALHGLLDFNLHIPANAIYFSALVAMVLHPEAEKAPAAKAERPTRPRPARPLPVPAEQVGVQPNPFGNN